MIRDDAKAKVLLEMENNAIFHTNSDVENSIQEVYDEVVVYARLIEKQFTLSLEANKTYYDLAALITDFYCVNSIYCVGPNLWLHGSTREAFRKYRLDWELQTGTPREYCIISPRIIGICPRPVVAEGELVIYYSALAPTLGSTTILELPESTKDVIVQGSTCDMMEQAHEFQKANNREAQYDSLLQSTRKFMLNRAGLDRIFTLCQYGRMPPSMQL